MRALRLLLVLTVLVCLPAVSRAAAPSEAEDPGTSGVEDPETVVVREMLRRGVSFLGTQRTFRVIAEEYEESSTLRHLGTTVVTVRRPDAIRVELSRADGARHLATYDGRRLAVRSPRYTANVGVQSTAQLDAILAALAPGFQSPLPIDLSLSGLLSMDLAPLVDGAVRQGRVIGKEEIAGRETSRVLVSAPRAEVQVWIEDGATPLPHRVVVDHPGEPARHATRTDLRWELGVEPAADAFVIEGVDAAP